MEIDSSFGDLDGLKESGSKKRYYSALPCSLFFSRENTYMYVYIYFQLKFHDELAFASYFLICVCRKIIRTVLVGLEYFY